MRAVKKMFKSPAKRRAGPKKRNLKASPKKRKQPKAVQRPVRSVKSAPNTKKVKIAKKKTAPVPKKAASKIKIKNVKPPKPVGLLVGEVTHYFDRIKVCVIRIDRDHIKKGDRLLIRGTGAVFFLSILTFLILVEGLTERTGR